ncbi:DUF1173 family protein [Acinetobacter baumannii]|uniref:DUF1173 family protein n=1 Tax=Acinetobacter baumannii TaxID=470 RepID=UPI0008DDF728|nr:DUF1173 family protein [Acinetobacter baumannii]MCE6930373.1 DUF1173 domain-containing protein [Acinetobacter baumannii]MCZ0638431.1 DUF1173 family protein [Acinetobacter baumannii]MVO43814.1 DUF1173 family protein [Acinetobacter baumannii]OIB66658.1 hypothetical protein A7L34_12490 [Acinetobacter baumannii]OIE94422.1 hypothetical protein A7L81_02850 [Acinetobacter baumannii]
MNNFIHNGKLVNVEDDVLTQAILQDCYQKGIRPTCSCLPDKNIEMYIAKIGDNFVLKRMPNSADQHHFDCLSYEPPNEISGLGEVMGEAIKTDETGASVLKFEFSLSKSNVTKQAPTPSETPKDTVKAETAKLTLKGTLDYLLDEALLNRHRPNMRHNWFQFRKAIKIALNDKKNKKDDLSSLVYIPEYYDQTKHNEIEARRKAELADLKVKGTKRPLKIFIGVIKSIDDARFDGGRIILKHAPTLHLFMDAKMYTRVKKRFEPELEQAQYHEDVSLLAIGTFGFADSGIAKIEEIALVPLNSSWLPFDSLEEKELLDTLAMQNRSFIKCLRYNLSKNTPIANILLTDTDPPTAFYLTNNETEESYIAEAKELIANSEFVSVLVNLDREVVEIPPPQHKPMIEYNG